jgi:hypothetical protein
MTAQELRPTFSKILSLSTGQRIFIPRCRRLSTECPHLFAQPGGAGNWLAGETRSRPQLFADGLLGHRRLRITPFATPPFATPPHSAWRNREGTAALVAPSHRTAPATPPSATPRRDTTVRDTEGAL